MTAKEIAAPLTASGYHICLRLLEGADIYQIAKNCRTSVEMIEKHYAGQIAELEHCEPELAAELTKFRDEEIAHRDHALEGGAKDAPGYPVLAAVIRAGCRAAIKISEKL